MPPSSAVSTLGGLQRRLWLWLGRRRRGSNRHDGAGPQAIAPVARGSSPLTSAGPGGGPDTERRGHVSSRRFALKKGSSSWALPVFAQRLSPRRLLGPAFRLRRLAPRVPRRGASSPVISGLAARFQRRLFDGPFRSVAGQPPSSATTWTRDHRSSLTRRKTRPVVLRRSSVVGREAHVIHDAAVEVVHHVAPASLLFAGESRPPSCGPRSVL
jgi:hypothetical protein